MSQIRYFVHRVGGAWSVRRDSKPLGAFGDESEATQAADRSAAVDRVRGHQVEILKMDEDGRWSPCGRP